MTINSNISSNFNAEFPLPGVDNDTQVFRDNFNTIKSSLSSAKTEIEQFLNYGVRTDTETTDFNGHVLTNSKLTKVNDLIYNYNSVQVANFIINYNNGPYQIAVVGTDLSIQFENFPSDMLSSGKVRLHLTSSSTAHNTITFTTTSGETIKYDNNFPTIDDSTVNSVTTRHIGVSSTDNPVIIDVWKFGTVYYLKYVGFFS